jgi:hypothetical protein
LLNSSIANSMLSVALMLLPSDRKYFIIIYG